MYILLLYYLCNGLFGRGGLLLLLLFILFAFWPNPPRDPRLFPLPIRFIPNPPLPLPRPLPLTPRNGSKLDGLIYLTLIAPLSILAPSNSFCACLASAARE